MKEETRDYIDFLKRFDLIYKPEMPIFDLNAYNDNEYMLAMQELNFEFDKIDDLFLTLEHLEGD